MEIKMKREKLIAVGLALVLAVGTLSGCSVKSDTPIIGKIAGLESNQVFKVGDLICTKPEYMLALMDSANKFKNDFGGTVDWNAKVDGNTTLGDYVLEKLKQDLSVKYTLASMAEESGVTLSTDEKAAASDAAKLYYENISDSEAHYTDASEDDVISLYTNYMLADKVYDKITADVDGQVSDEEARVIKIQYIRMNTATTKENKIKSTMKTVTDLVNGGYQEFSREAKENSEDDTIELVLKKNEAEKPFEVAAFNLNSKEMSSIIQDGQDYYLIYCVDSYMKTESAENKAELIKTKKDEKFNSEYKKFLKNTETDFNSKSIENIKLPNDEDIKSCNLITNYNSIKIEE